MIWNPQCAVSCGDVSLATREQKTVNEALKATYGVFQRLNAGLGFGLYRGPVFGCAGLYHSNFKSTSRVPVTIWQG